MKDKLWHVAALSPCLLCFLGFLFALASLPLRAQQLVFEFDPRQTQVDFTLGATLHTVHGTFVLKSGRILLDPATGKAGGQIVVDATSGRSGNEDRDKDMHRKVLESQKFPEIVFLPDHIEGRIAPQGDFHVTVHGLFRLHGADHETTFDVQAQRKADGIALTLQFPIPYVKWGLKNPSKLFLRVSDQVQITVHSLVRPVT